MASRLDVSMDQIRLRILSKDSSLCSIQDVCQWISADGSHCLKQKNTLSEDKAREIRSFWNTSTPSELSSLAASMCEDVFCAEHAATAKLYCPESSKRINDDDAPAAESQGSGTEVAVPEEVQLLYFGDDGTIHSNYVSTSTLPQHEKPIFDQTGRVATLPSVARKQTDDRGCLAEFSGEDETSGSNNEDAGLVGRCTLQNGRAEDGDEGNVHHADRCYKRNNIGSDASVDADVQVNEDKFSTPKPRAHKADLDPDSASIPHTRPTLSPYARTASETAAIHPMWDYEVEANEGCLSRKFEEDLQLNEVGAHGKPRKIPYGFVYAVRDPELQWIKVGQTFDPNLFKRLGGIKNTCKPGPSDGSLNLKILGGTGNTAMVEYKRLEQIVHQALKPYNVTFRCRCKGGTTHEEWFKIPGQVALDTIHFWQRVMLQNPYCIPAIPHPVTYPLGEIWVERLNMRVKPGPDEQHTDHETRLRRWKQTLFPDAPTTDGLESKVPVSTVHQLPQRPKFTGRSRQLSSNVAVEFKGPSSPETPSRKPRAASAQPQLESLEENVLTADNTEPMINKLLKPAEMGQSGNPSEKQCAENVTASSAQYTSEGVLQSTQASDCQTKRSVPFAVPAPKSEPCPTSADASDSCSSQPARSLPGEKRQEETSTQLIRQVSKLLQSVKQEMPPWIWDDVVRFRWQLAFAFTFGVFTPYVPAGLAFVTWCVFLPLFVGELRSWSVMEGVSV
ncbi:uncharacterized protein LTR77_004698 [Saxophila tyrrhenica]|uniref:Bacteriophage T5 Orf172 DNA-binding domain-containing protein n=1 Tax=Saxophila tyrrhenica TaxID=1690608 RepID=A0AAV9P9T4_9PEZI|nr:hypothetical protein LTR77_004698 [Saxophila tyrrhenica]